MRCCQGAQGMTATAAGARVSGAHAKLATCCGALRAWIECTACNDGKGTLRPQRGLRAEPAWARFHSGDTTTDMSQPTNGCLRHVRPSRNQEHAALCPARPAWYIKCMILSTEWRRWLLPACAGKHTTACPPSCPRNRGSLSLEFQVDPANLSVGATRARRMAASTLEMVYHA